jgi:acyl carrier protein
VNPNTFHSTFKDLLLRLFEDRFENIQIGNETGLVSDLQLSSLDMVSIVLELESEVGLQIPADEVPISEIRTVGDLRNIIAGQPAAPKAQDALSDSLSRGIRRRRRR